MATDEFTCDQCGETFMKNRPDEEAQAESLARWGELDDPAIVCGDCFAALVGDLDG